MKLDMSCWHFVFIILPIILLFLHWRSWFTFCWGFNLWWVLHEVFVVFLYVFYSKIIQNHRHKVWANNLVQLLCGLQHECYLCKFGTIIWGLKWKKRQKRCQSIPWSNWQQAIVPIPGCCQCDQGIPSEFPGQHSVFSYVHSCKILFSEWIKHDWKVMKILMHILVFI